MPRKDWVTMHFQVDRETYDRLIRVGHIEFPWRESVAYLTARKAITEYIDRKEKEHKLGIINKEVKNGQA